MDSLQGGLGGAIEERVIVSDFAWKRKNPSAE